MLALKILEIKDFMNKLLINETFDSFELIEASITTFNIFSINGKLQRDFFDTDARDILDQKGVNYSLWKEIKPYCYSIIRGKRTPLNFKVILRLPTQQMRSALSQIDHGISPDLVDGLFLNLQYKNKELLCTTGVSTHTFLLDKSLEHNWDSMVLELFRKQDITFESL